MTLQNFIKRALNKNVTSYKKYAYFKLAYSRGCNQLQILKEVIASIPELLILFGITKFKYTQSLMDNFSPVLLAILLLLFLLSEKFMTFVVGHIDLRNDLMSIDVSLSNKYNPEIRTILSNTKNGTKRDRRDIRE